MLACIYGVQWSATNWLFFLFDTAELTTQQFFRCVAWGASALIAAFILKMTPEHWVEKLPVGIHEEQVMGAGNAMMRAYESQKNAKVIKEEVAENEKSICTENDGEDQVPDEKDDDFKAA